MNKFKKVHNLVAMLLAHAVSVCAATNDLVITSITRENDCTTLRWRSHPGEFYNVYWTDALKPPAFWRVAAIHVPADGTNTVWSECEEGMMGMMGGGGGGFANGLKSGTTEAEVRARYETNRPNAEATLGEIKRLLREAMDKRKEPVAGPEASSLLAPPPPVGGGGSGGTNGVITESKFYRVARVAVVGVVDGSDDPPAGLTNIIAVAAGVSHNLAIRSNGTVVAWGDDSSGQSTVPTNLTDVIAVAAGWYHSVVAKRDGSVVAWGQISLGQTNVPAGVTNVIDVRAGWLHNMALKADGTVAAWGGYFPTSNAVPAGLSNVTAIAAGSLHCLALKSDGNVVAWAFYPYSFPIPTNVPSTLSNVIAITAGISENYALLKSGSVVAWNNQGFTNFPAGLSNVFAIAAAGNGGVALKTDTSLASWVTATHQGLSNVVAIAAGGLDEALLDLTTRWLCIVTNTDNVVIRRQPQSLAIPLGRSTNIYVTATSVSLSYQWEKQSGATWIATPRLSPCTCQPSPIRLLRWMFASARDSLRR